MRLEIPKISNVRTSAILLYCSIVLTIFVYYGSADFYENHFGPVNGPISQYYYFLASFVLMGIIPVLIWRFGFGDYLKDMGLSLGISRLSLIIAIAGIPVMVLIAYLTADNPDFMAEYPLYRGLLHNHSVGWQYWLMYGLYYIGWEVFFRGFMLFGLKSKFGELNSVLIQTIPSCLIHIGKPDGEIFSAIFAGIVFGIIVLKTRSIWPIFIWHWTLGVALDIFIVYGR